MRRALAILGAIVVVACGGGADAPAGGGAASPAPPPGDGTIPSSDGVPIAYEVHGEGPIALLFIHGWLCDRSHWVEQIEAFSGDHTVVTLDLGGHGESGKQRPGWPLAAFGRDVRSVVEALQLERVILVGHSMGGPVALEAAALMPERVLGVVGVDTLHDAEQRMSPEMAEQIRSRFDADFVETCHEFVRQALFIPQSDPELVQRITAGMCDDSPEIAMTLWEQFLDYDATAALAALEVPFRGINRAVPPTNVASNRKYAADYDVRVMQGVGHFPMLERPDEFNLLLAEIVEELTGL